VKEVSTIVKSPKNVCYLQITMNYCAKYLISGFTILLVFIGVISCSNEPDTTFADTVKLALRDVGHHILLSNKDSTSLVNPVKKIGPLKFQVSFESSFSINPDSLVAIIKSSFKKAHLPLNYLTEVIRCHDQEVAYSYEMKMNEEKGIIPCSGRELHKDCYMVTVRFTKAPETFTNNTKLIFLVLIIVLALVVFVFYKRKPKLIPTTQEDIYETIGRYKFYPGQNKLIKEATEISLSKKECELLSIFIAKPNQIIKRDELTKKVWEDNGVFVSRSLDTYISKLRKKLQEDPSIKLTNIHGIGYKLEI